LTLKPALTFSRIDGTNKSTSEKAVLLSDMNYNVGLEVQQSFSPSFALYYGFEMQRENYKSDPDNPAVTLNGPTFWTNGFYVKAANRLNPLLEISGALNIAHHVFYTTPDTTSVSLVKMYLPRLEVGSDFTLWKTELFRLNADLGANLMMPLAGKVAAKFGYGFGAGLGGTSKLGSYDLGTRVFFNYDGYASDEVTLKRKDMGIVLSLTKNFGEGAKTKVAKTSTKSAPATKAAPASKSKLAAMPNFNPAPKPAPATRTPASTSARSKK
jgi:hypothetical protein